LLKRISARVPLADAEEARAEWLERFPDGFEERDLGPELELAAYVEEIPPDVDGLHVEPVEAGWEERWREFHRPVRVGPLWLGPPWQTPPRDATAIVIEPGLAFGTGAHPSTRLCVEFLLELERGSLLDLGCGSGVLSVAAATLGFSPVTAVDHDPRAIAAAEQNAIANRVRVETLLLDVRNNQLPRADVAVANIDLVAVNALASTVDADRVVASGYYELDRPQLDRFRLLARRTLDGWAADLYGRE
jgi:ribosomal protein L11 methyltransferase